jgi:arsenate reductase (thioredoxin)
MTQSEGNSMQKIKVLFICTGNSARSQIAEAFLRHYGSDRFEAYSAGLEPKPINPFAIAVMNEIGIDISQQRSKDLFEYFDKISFDFVITLCSNAQARCPIFPDATERLHWALDDPAEFVGNNEQTLEVFRETREQIRELVRNFIKAG